ncbi:asparaginase [Paenibacillus cremeus]|uniref:Asparaginase n=1 Tax=Paenibacillus cremeus TaxID=2163881 RepID=A0A559K9D7_9BACL|nr:asparaginase [Paenibacillus cremeus]TVY08729.1 asparaginase [Paenibacillus cremeus]
MPSSCVSELLIEVTRGKLTECVHRGHIAVVDIQGRLLGSAGNPEFYTFARSTAKLVQAIPLLEAGGAERFTLTPEETALCCASHNGEPEHADTALAILHKLGLDESALHCGCHEPFYKPAADALKRSGQPLTQLHNNCSGKHAGMLALCACMEASIQEYTSPAHPVQQKMLHTVAEMCGVSPDSIQLGTDGCGVPVFAVPLSALALAYARLGCPDQLPERRAEACRAIVQAIRKAPYYVAGTERFDTRLVEVTQGRIIGKMGAEGVYALTVPERGIGLALKIEDGAERALYPTAVEALLQMELLSVEEAAQLAGFHQPIVPNRRDEAVGVIRPAFRLKRAE